MKVKKSYSGLVIIFLLILTFVTTISAITGSIGNARMILRDIETGDTIEKSILVKNVNDVSVDIELFASGDLEDAIDIKDNEFRLEPQTEKKAYFTIKVKKPGTTETKINVKFTPVNGGNGVGLSSTIIIIAEEGPGFIENLFNKDDNPENPENPDENNNNKPSSNILKITLSITAIIFLILIILLSFASKKKKREFKVEIKNSKLKSKEIKKNEK